MIDKNQYKIRYKENKNDTESIKKINKMINKFDAFKKKIAVMETKITNSFVPGNFSDKFKNAANQV